MRIISGSRRGIPLKTIPGNTTRPTTDKVKESIFNMIGPYFDGGIAVELFGGSGALAFESLSRGADTAYIFEKNPKACTIIKENADKCRFSEAVTIFKADARTAAKKLDSMDIRADFLFVDPPYAKAEFYDLVNEFIAQGRLTEDAVIVCEHEKQLELPEAYGDYGRTKHVIYGSSAVSIYRK